MASLLAFDDVHSEGRADNTELANFVVGVEAIVLERCNHRAGAESSEIAAFAAEIHVEYSRAAASKVMFPFSISSLK